MTSQGWQPRGQFPSPTTTSPPFTRGRDNDADVRISIYACDRVRHDPQCSPGTLEPAVARKKSIGALVCPRCELVRRHEQLRVCDLVGYRQHPGHCDLTRSRQIFLYNLPSSAWNLCSLYGWSLGCWMMRRRR
ncbi:uncharacterized protein LOC119326678 isoform X1 [Triticum dicoccoides]|uniref:uncharacterized protein LOC119326678 isoform X1 n=1 Tax=Triticum dicoccoides TaxID=85692 RepID=UPI0018919F00|nr:uncharacterized protein LOC119326678 isoform X1 [Triticum dicoccoides]